MVKLAAILPAATLLLASFSGVVADLQVTSPSSSIWWGAYNFSLGGPMPIDLGPFLFNL